MFKSDEKNDIKLVVHVGHDENGKVGGTDLNKPIRNYWDALCKPAKPASYMNKTPQSYRN